MLVDRDGMCGTRAYVGNTCMLFESRVWRAGDSVFVARLFQEVRWWMMLTEERSYAGLFMPGQDAIMAEWINFFLAGVLTYHLC